MEHILGKREGEGGFVLIAVYFLLAALVALLGVYVTITRIELAATKHSKDSLSGFYAAEGALNVRAEAIRQVFVGYNLPKGAPPDPAEPCTGGNQGSQDFACAALQMNNRTVTTFVAEDPDNPVDITIPPGERYQNLHAQEFRYTVRSVARNVEQKAEAVLELRFKSRLVPMFQFTAFYDKDLEILPGPHMNLSGPIHTNGDLYLNTHNALHIDGQVTTGGALYRGRKNDSSCDSKPVTVRDPVQQRPLRSNCPNRVKLEPQELDPWNGMIEVFVPTVTVPEPDFLEAKPGAIYWDKADLRLALRLQSNGNPLTSPASPTGVYVMNLNQTTNTSATQTLHGCSGGISGRVVGTSSSFYNNREKKNIRMLEVSMRELFNCLHSTSWLGTNARKLDDDTEGGLVFHFSVDGPQTNAASNSYGVRIRNSAKLQATLASAPRIRGLTVVTDQASYTHGDYNAVEKIPAAIMSDSFNVLSGDWNLSDSNSTKALSNRRASSTTIFSAVLSGTDTTGGLDGHGGQGGAYNGGLENYPRFHEDWTGRKLTYRGSFVSLNEPRHVTGKWIYGSPQYEAPLRDWDYDTDFNNVANLPPLSPRFVYLRQELFVRDFDGEL